MQISRELDYGIRAVVVLAKNLDGVLSKRKIAEDFGIPVNFLAIILPKLVHASIVESLPGPKGGYRLARSATEISLFDVICAIDKVFAFNRCMDLTKGCEFMDKCPVRTHWNKIQNYSENYLKGVTFDSLVRRAGEFN